MCECVQCVYVCGVQVYTMCLCVVHECGLTGEDGADLGPAGDPSFRGELTQCNLQEEHRQAAPKQEDGVRDEKST